MAREGELGGALRMGSPVGDVNSQNYLSFQQPLKRTPPGPFPRGATSPLSRQDEPGGGRRGQPSGVRLPVGMTSGWLLGACAGLVGRQQLRPEYPPHPPLRPAYPPHPPLLRSPSRLKLRVHGGREPGLRFLLSPLGTVPFLQLSLQGLFAKEGSQEPLDGQGYRCLG